MDKFEEYRLVKREPVAVGESYPFYSTLEGKDGYGIQCRQYTGQTVLVVEDTTNETDDERIFKVRASNGIEFSAWEGELNGWFYDTRQFYSPEGKWASHG